MTADDKSILKSILEHISGMDYIKPEDLPKHRPVHGSGHHVYGGSACIHKASR